MREGRKGKGLREREVKRERARVWRSRSCYTLAEGREVGITNSIRVRVELMLVVGPFGHLTFSEPGWA